MHSRRFGDAHETIAGGIDVARKTYLAALGNRGRLDGRLRDGAHDHRGAPIGRAAGRGAGAGHCGGAKDGLHGCCWFFVALFSLSLSLPDCCWRTKYAANREDTYACILSARAAFVARGKRARQRKASTPRRPPRSSRCGASFALELPQVLCRKTCFCCPLHLSPGGCSLPRCVALPPRRHDSAAAAVRAADAAGGSKQKPEWAKGESSKAQSRGKRGLGGGTDRTARHNTIQWRHTDDGVYAAPTPPPLIRPHQAPKRPRSANVLDDVFGARALWYGRHAQPIN